MSRPSEPEIPRTFDSVLDLLEASRSRNDRLWVRSNVPNIMMFTDDDGDDYLEDADGNFTIPVEAP